MASSAPVDVDGALAGRKAGWFNDKGIMKVNLILFLTILSGYANGYDGSMMNGLQSLDEWKDYFNQPTASTLALLNAIQHVGQLIALPFCAYSCDRFGRRLTLIVSAGVLLIGVALQAAAQNIGMFVFARALIGFAIAFNFTAAPLLIMELAFPTQKSALVGFFNAQWNSGAIVAAWTTYGTFRIQSSWAWRIPSALQALSSVIQILGYFTIVESPRWLISKDRDDEARKIITKYHANGNPNDPLVSVEMNEIREALRIDNDVAKNTSFLSFLHSKGNRLRLVILVVVGFFSQWSGNGLISYYLTLILDSIGYKAESTQTLINAVLALWSLFSTAFVAFFMVDRFPRRTLFLVSTTGMLISFVVWTALEASYEKQVDAGGVVNTGYAKGVLAMIVLYNTSFNIGWTPLQVTYVCEILPYNLRARGLVLYSFAVALALIFNQYVNPIALAKLKWHYYIVYDVWLLVELVVVYFLFIETSGSSLEEISLLIDGPELKAKMVDNVAQATAINFPEEKQAGMGIEHKEMREAADREVA
ncbi:general substrate transporter [Hyaloscypha bicolor E]|uniref:General substrate transporter n=1 Tax=Hyaloscypha bicolor E TaxID=1095630 RepID=A0A2J6T954_9HELO|nr:general substrate transporter [Hyaloscypha bicolor E]PMD59559.1 general substrate transporter [Hyaloscypha bicolor E]